MTSIPVVSNFGNSTDPIPIGAVFEKRPVRLFVEVTDFLKQRPSLKHIMDNQNNTTLEKIQTFKTINESISTNISPDIQDLIKIMKCIRSTSTLLVL